MSLKCVIPCNKYFYTLVTTIKPNNISMFSSFWPDSLKIAVEFYFIVVTTFNKCLSFCGYRQWQPVQSSCDLDCLHTGTFHFSGVLPLDKRTAGSACMGIVLKGVQQKRYYYYYLTGYRANSHFNYNTFSHCR